MNDEFYAEVLQNDEEGKLILRLDESPRMRFIYLGDSVDSKIVNCININGGALLVGFNGQKRINSLEMNVPRKNWLNMSDNRFSRPNQAFSGVVEFVNMNLVHERTKCFDIPLAVFTDKEQSAVKIEIGTSDRANSTWLAISKNCLVELLDKYLIGFWIDLLEL